MSEDGLTDHERSIGCTISDVMPSDEFYIWKTPDADYCLPEKAKVGKWEDREKLFEGQ